MKKISLLIFAAAAAGAVGCSQDSALTATESVSSIGFITNTSRATVATITTLQDDESGFVVYGTKENAAGEWDTQMAGKNYYVYDDGVWGWSNGSPAWPETGSDEYSIDFYAIYSLDQTGLTISDDSQTVLALTYAPPTSGQSDVLVATATAEVRPSGDKLPLIFNHILSKVTFGITPGDDVTVYTQSVGFNDICSSRDYDLYYSKWKDQNSAYVDDYSFLDTVNPAVNSDKADIVGTNGDLMILPQSTVSWQAVSGDSSVSGCHIYLFYRAETADDSNLLGYAKASDHPDYTDEYAAMSDEPLFVKVGYPIGSTTFEPAVGMSYEYDINIGTDGATNGYLLDEYYYDADGFVTTFEVKGKDVSDPLSDGYINFTVSVNVWEETTTTIE